MIKRSVLSGQWVVRIVCALALLFVGFAPPPDLYPDAIPASVLAQYTLPDGTVPLLGLLSEDGKSHHGGHDLGSGCEACHLTASILLPAPADLCGAPIRREIEHSLPARSEAF